MSIKKTIQNEMDVVYEGLNKLTSILQKQENCINLSLADFAKKLDVEKSPSWLRVVISVRNWLTHILLWVLLALLLSSCFVSGRSITLQTPRVDITADTATAYTWPYNTKFQ